MRLLAIALVAAGALFSSSNAIAQSASAHPDAAAVQGWLQEYEASWTAADGERMYRAATDDVEWVNIVGMHWRGRSEVVAAHVAYLTTMFRDTPLRLLGVESIRSVGEDGLVVVARWSVGQFTTPTGHVIPPSEDRMTLVFERADGGLKLVHGANVQIDAVAAASNPVRPATAD